jgi:HAD superfamily hydrolase (TIGR01509 family)
MGNHATFTEPGREAASRHVADFASIKLMCGCALIIFDCDGVLVDSELASCDCLTELLREQGVRTTREEIFGLFLGHSVKSVIAHYAALGQSLSPDFEAQLRSRVREIFAKELRPIPEIAEVLPRLGCAYCVASSSDLDRVNFSLQLTGLAGLFGDRVFTAQMVARGKPAPDLFLYAALKMNVTPADALVVEDSVSGVKAGKAAGMTVWGFVGGSHHASSESGASLEAAGADRVFDRMTDLLTLEAGEIHGQPDR